MCPLKRSSRRRFTLLSISSDDSRASLRGLTVMWWVSLIRDTIAANRSVVLAIVGSVLGAPVIAAAQGPNLADRLGYSRDAKLLILHADDLAVANSVDRASFAALESKAVRSASVMVPCPWLTEVAEYLQRHPETDLGLHVTLTSE